jgi:hypothetical protein
MQRARLGVKAREALQILNPVNPSTFLCVMPDKPNVIGSFENRAPQLSRSMIFDSSEAWKTAARMQTALMAMTDRTGHTELHCFEIDGIVPMKVHLTKQAISPRAAGNGIRTRAK